MNLRNPKSSKSDQLLYEQALTSLKELNDEVFLNRFREEVQGLLKSIQAEVNDLSDAIKKEKSYIQSAVESMNRSVKTVNNQTISNSQEMKQDIQVYFHNFSIKYENGIERIQGLINQSNEYSEGLITSYVNEYELRIQQTEETQRERDEQLKSISIDFENHISLLVSVHTRWLETLFEFKRGMADRFTAIEQNIERQQNVLGETEEKLLNQIRHTDEMIVKANQEMRCSAEKYEENGQTSFEEQKRLFKQIEIQLVERINDIENSITQFKNERKDWETAISSQKVIWENEMTERSEIDALNRTQMVEELKNANELLALQTLQELQAENSQLSVRHETLAKQNRLFMSGLIVLSALQIVLHFI